MEGFDGVEDEYVSTADDVGTDAEADEMEITDDDVSDYSIHRFMEDLQRAGRLYKPPERGQELWVFRREDNSQDRIPHPSPTCTAPGGITKSDPATIQHKIRILLSSLDFYCCYYISNILVQFWEPIKVEDQCFLTTSDQPFGLSRIHKGLCDYRIHSETCRFNVDIEENPSIPGRVFRYKWPEFTPNVRYYSIEEHPLPNYAESGEIQNSVALPIYEKSSRLCVGVLELVETNEEALVLAWDVLMGRAYRALEMVGLESTYLYYISEGIHNLKIGDQEAEEIQRILDVAATKEEILLAQTWVTCKHEKALDSTCAEDFLFAFKDLYYKKSGSKMSLFRHFTVDHPMRKCHGVVGKALLARKPSFCEDVTKFSISDYPFVHYARHYGLSSCFAVLLLSTYFPSESYYIIELFLQPSDTDSGVPQTLLNSILSMMRQELKCLKVASAEEQGEGFPFQVITSYRNDECAPSTMHRQTSTLPSVSQAIQRMQAEDPVSRPDELIGESVLRTDKRNVDGPDQRSIAAAMPMAEGTHASGLKGELKNNNDIPLSREVLQQQFGKKLVDAAKNLGVSPSTLKRACRDVGIPQWPYSRRKKGGRSPPNSHAKRFVRPRKKRMVEPIKEVSSYPDVLPSEGTTSHVVTASQSTGCVTIKATCRRDTIMFPFSLTSGLKKLKEEVTKRLDFGTGTFKLKYRDNEKELILIACDDDLRACINCSRPADNNTVRISIVPMTNQAP